jgi:hypothetical protein
MMMTNQRVPTHQIVDTLQGVWIPEMVSRQWQSESSRSRSRREEKQKKTDSNRAEDKYHWLI